VAQIKWQENMLYKTHKRHHLTDKETETGAKKNLGFSELAVKC